ncbi:MBOAT family O-acyltransferase [Reichenbachiella ulvae]|uniref:MBOAT family protein n=1 Tax=Reichenbachiella ulvae TaxID=2980104 RepID=A0ABT3CNB0_9BACT|nr:MBOAT family O-acyltransferase [Reichenbachiella ulvae]MCV9385036.1 MBOAT family protein [Reichenbachiella ulvae]
MFSTVVDYLVTIGMGKIENIHKRRFLLMCSLIANLGLLFSFKYYDFFNNAMADTLGLFGYEYSYSMLNLLLPVGISFYTFQTLSYTLEVYHRRIEPERNFGIFALYVSFFPQLVAGPIERPQHLLPQLKKLSDIIPENLSRGLRLMLWGLFKKMVIADRAAYFVNEVFNAPGEYHGLSVVIGMVFFSFQIYCDFSGYSDMAIGAARIFGIDLMKNFDSPYFSKSIKEFWSRWHISLSTWFKDYVYIPLGGNRTTTPRWIFNLFITFFISGIWHGANWTFVIWGAIHGLAMAVEAVSSKFELFPIKMNRYLAIIWTFVIVTIAWVFFRANKVGDVWVIFGNALDFSTGLADFKSMRLRDLFNVVIPIPFILILLIGEKMFKLESFRNTFYRTSSLRMASYIGIIVIIAFYGVFREQSDFIYFQF